MAISPPRAVILLSGGVDSATVLAMARDDGFALYALSFAYGQRHVIELDAARRIAEAALVVDHKVVRLDPDLFGGSALTDDISVPKDRDPAALAGTIPVTYVPARNTVFLAHAVAWAEVIGAQDIFIGVNALDYSGYPDCRPEYVEAFERMANLATKAGVAGSSLKIRAPLIQLSKAEIIQRGLALGVDYAITVSCYDPDASAAACGRCDACQLRLRGFRELDAKDPAVYRETIDAR